MVFPQEEKISEIDRDFSNSLKDAALIWGHDFSREVECPSAGIAGEIFVSVRPLTAYVLIVSSNKVERLSPWLAEGAWLISVYGVCHSMTFSSSWRKVPSLAFSC